MSPQATAAGPPAAADATEGPSSPQPQVMDLLTAGASNHLQATHTVWVRAVTDVEAVELAKEDMQWAVEHDYRLGSELRQAMYLRRRELRKKQKEKKAQESEEAQEKEGSASPQQALWSPMWSPKRTPKAAALFDAVPEFVLDGDDDGSGGGGDPAFALSAPDEPSPAFAERLSEYKAGISAMMAEYFQAQEVGEVAARLAELQVLCGSVPAGAADAASSLGAVFVKRAIVTSLDFTAREFELTSVVLSALAPGMLASEDIQAAFEALLEGLMDLTCDVPTAPSLLPLFLARCIVDETLSAACLESLGEAVSSRAGVKVLAATKALLEASDGPAKVLRAWGGGGAGSVAHSKAAFATILGDFTAKCRAGGCAKEGSALRFLCAPACVADWLHRAYAEVLQEQPADPLTALAEKCRAKAASLPADSAAGAGHEAAMAEAVTEACRHLRELCVPHFLWDAVRQAALLALAEPGLEACLVALLSRAFESGLVLGDQIELGLSMVSKADAAASALGERLASAMQFRGKAAEARRARLASLQES